MRAALLAVILLLLPARAPAGIEVVASIAPIHSLAAQVMEGAGRHISCFPPAPRRTTMH